MTTFAERLLFWWDENGRKDLPWQRDRTPYRVWVSEIMLQQTQVTTVIGYFERFIEAFPTVAHLANAPIDRVLHAWSGLGYYSRARNLHRAAVDIMAEHAGELPTDPRELEKLAGIGRSTAAAIVAQAHGKRATILDGNVKRVLSRQFRIDGDPTRAATQAALWSHAEALTPWRRVADYTQAIMDLGATVCTRTNPLCEDCAVERSCGAREHGDWASFPARKTKPTTRRHETRRFYVAVTRDGSVWLERRPDEGIWGGLYSPPEYAPGTPIERFLADTHLEQADVHAVHECPPIEHGFTHFDLTVHPIVVVISQRPDVVAERSAGWFDDPDAPVGLSTIAARLMRLARSFTEAFELT